MPVAADVNANLLRNLKLLQSLGEAVPHGGILKAVAGIGITILETAERVRQNKEECADIARRAAEHISVLKRLDEGEELSDDLVERLERYHSVLKEILEKVERLGTAGPSWKRTLRALNVQDETKDCLNRLNEAYQMYIFESSIATDNKLTTIVRGMAALSLRLDSQRSMSMSERGKIDLERLEFGEQIVKIEKKTYILRIEHGKMLDLNTGRPKAVILRRFEVKPEVDDEDRALEEFKKEIAVRGDLLNRHVARMFGIASSDTGRTKMIVVEAGTISAYEYLQNLSGLEYFLDLVRIICESVAGYKFLREHRGSWRGGYQDVLLNARDKRLCMGGLGRMDDRWEDSGMRVGKAYNRLRQGDDSSWGGSRSFEHYAALFERMRESLTKWSQERTEENARDLWKWLGYLDDSSKTEQRTETSRSVGEIGWEEGNDWHPIPVVHQFPPAQPPEFFINASRLRDGEWDTVVGTRIEGFTRWSIDVFPGEETYLHTFVRSFSTSEIVEFFYGSALSLARDLGVDVCSLGLVSIKGFYVDAFLTVFEPLAVHYFAHPPNPNGSVPDPPGFWSLCPDPVCSDCPLRADAANIRYCIVPFVRHERIHDQSLSLFQDLESVGFLPIADITYTSSPPFATISEVSEQQAPEPIIPPRGKNRRAKDLFSIFTKKRKVSIS